MSVVVVVILLSDKTNDNSWPHFLDTAGKTNIFELLDPGIQYKKKLTKISFHQYLFFNFIKTPIHMKTSFFKWEANIPMEKL